MTTKSLAAAILSVALILPLATANAAGFAVTNGVISGLYVHTPGSVVKVNLQGTVNSSGCTHAPYVILPCDYTTAAKTEATKSMITALTAAFLAGKKVSIYSQGCVADPWAAGKTVPAVYDVELSN